MATITKPANTVPVATITGITYQGPNAHLIFYVYGTDHAGNVVIGTNQAPAADVPNSPSFVGLPFNPALVVQLGLVNVNFRGLVNMAIAAYVDSVVAANLIGQVAFPDAYNIVDPGTGGGQPIVSNVGVVFS